MTQLLSDVVLAAIHLVNENQLVIEDDIVEVVKDYKDLILKIESHVENLSATLHLNQAEKAIIVSHVLTDLLKTIDSEVITDLSAIVREWADEIKDVRTLVLNGLSNVQDDSDSESPVVLDQEPQEEFPTTQASVETETETETETQPQESVETEIQPQESLNSETETQTQESVETETQPQDSFPTQQASVETETETQPQEQLEDEDEDDDEDVEDTDSDSHTVN